MAYKSILVVFAVFLIAEAAFAQQETEKANKFIEENSAFFESKVVQSLFGNERMNITANMNDGTVIKLGVVTRNGRVAEVKEPAIENPTVKITASEEALQNIQSAVFDPQAELQKQLDKGGIRYDPLGIVPTIKFTVLGLINSVFSFFRNIFAPQLVTDNCFSEDGDDKARQGTTIKGSTIFHDECVNESTLKEYYCSKRSVVFKFYDCACSEGICAG